MPTKHGRDNCVGYSHAYIWEQYLAVGIYFGNPLPMPIMGDVAVYTRTPRSCDLWWYIARMDGTLWLCMCTLGHMIDASECMASSAGQRRSRASASVSSNPR